MVQDTLVKVLVLIWLLVCAWQDWRTGEVANWLTLPPMAAAGIFALFAGRDAVLFFVAALMGVFILFYLGSFGGADAKILVVLAGFWPLAFLAAVLVQGVWGMVMMLRQGRKSGFRAVPTYAAGAMICLLIGML